MKKGNILLRQREFSDWSVALLFEFAVGSIFTPQSDGVVNVATRLVSVHSRTIG